MLVTVQQKRHMKLHGCVYFHFCKTDLRLTRLMITTYSAEPFVPRQQEFKIQSKVLRDIILCTREAAQQTLHHFLNPDRLDHCHLI